MDSNAQLNIEIVIVCTFYRLIESETTVKKIMQANLGILLKAASSIRQLVFNINPIYVPYVIVFNDEYKYYGSSALI